MSRTVVIVEDEELIASSVAARLRAEGLRAETAGDGPSGVELCTRLRPDLVILDLMLTARDSETDVLVGLGIGADDYMTKPFSQRELVARVHALLRRSEREATARAEGETIEIAGLVIDPPSRRCTVAGREIDLTRTEFDLLFHLARRPGTVFTRDELLRDVWNYADSAGERTVDSHIAGLRRKVGGGLIRTARGVGYALDPESGR